MAVETPIWIPKDLRWTSRKIPGGQLFVAKTPINSTDYTEYQKSIQASGRGSDRAQKFQFIRKDFLLSEGWERSILYDHADYDNTQMLPIDLTSYYLKRKFTEYRADLGMLRVRSYVGDPSLVVEDEKRSFHLEGDYSTGGLQAIDVIPSTVKEGYDFVKLILDYRGRSYENNATELAQIYEYLGDQGRKLFPMGDLIDEDKSGTGEDTVADLNEEDFQQRTSRFSEGQIEAVRQIAGMLAQHFTDKYLTRSSEDKRRYFTGKFTQEILIRVPLDFNSLGPNELVVNSILLVQQTVAGLLAIYNASLESVEAASMEFKMSDGNRIEIELHRPTKEDEDHTKRREIAFGQEFFYDGVVYKMEPIEEGMARMVIERLAGRRFKGEYAFPGSIDQQGAFDLISNPDLREVRKALKLVNATFRKLP